MRDVNRFTPLLLALLLAAPTAAQARAALKPEERARLERGELLITSQKVAGSSVMMGQAVGIFEDVPEAVLFVLLDIEKYKHYLPWVKDSRVVKRSGWLTFGVVETDLPWPAKDCWAYVKFTRRDRPGRVHEIEWTMINGTLKSYSGSARIEPWRGDVRRSLLTYRLRVEPAVSAPDSMVTKGVRRAVEAVVERSRLRLKALRKFQKLPDAVARPAGGGVSK